MSSMPFLRVPPSQLTSRWFLGHLGLPYPKKKKKITPTLPCEKSPSHLPLVTKLLLCQDT